MAYDTSDGLNFSAVNHVWNQVDGGLWTALGNQTWVLPADLSSIGCGVENTTTCEPVGHFISVDSWVSTAIGAWDILEADGSLSDAIITYNDENGHANLKFYSDPSIIPLPAALPLFAGGLGALGLLGWRKKRNGASAIAAA